MSLSDSTDQRTTDSAVGLAASPADGAGSNGAEPCPCGGAPPRRDRRFGWLQASHILLPLGVVVAFAAINVGWEVIQRHLFPSLSTGMRHLTLTLVAGVFAVVATWGVYWTMRRQQRRLTQTARQLTRLVESYQANPSRPAMFENPHVKACHEIVDCPHADCPMRTMPGERCWQVMALRRGRRHARGELEKCSSCEVYQEACPDGLTELGEAFNNLMCLLENEAHQTRTMRAQMVEKEKMVALGQIAAGVAHEVGNPLSSISSIVQMLKRAQPQGAMRSELDLIDTHVARITAIVRQMGRLARPARDTWELLDVGEVVREAVRLISYDPRASQVEISCDCPPTLPPTCGSRDQLQQVFINLALNALDAMPNGGTLRIEARPRRDSIVVRVIDTGGGISPETGRRVFEPFVTTKDPGLGTGLGLAVSYGIVQKHGGTIDFESHVGEGTVFTVELPLIESPPDARDAQTYDTSGRR